MLGQPCGIAVVLDDAILLASAVLIRERLLVVLVPQLRRPPPSPTPASLRADQVFEFFGGHFFGELSADGFGRSDAETPRKDFWRKTPGEHEGRTSGAIILERQEIIF